MSLKRQVIRHSESEEDDTKYIQKSRHVSVDNFVKAFDVFTYISKKRG